MYAQWKKSNVILVLIASLYSTHLIAHQLVLDLNRTPQSSLSSHPLLSLFSSSHHKGFKVWNWGDAFRCTLYGALFSLSWWCTRLVFKCTYRCVRKKPKRPPQVKSYQNRFVLMPRDDLTEQRDYLLKFTQEIKTVVVPFILKVLNTQPDTYQELQRIMNIYNPWNREKKDNGNFSMHSEPILAYKKKNSKNKLRGDIDQSVYTQDEDDEKQTILPPTQGDKKRKDYTDEHNKAIRTIQTAQITSRHEALAILNNNQSHNNNNRYNSTGHHVIGSISVSSFKE